MKNTFSLSYKGLPVVLISELDELKEYFGMGLLTFSEWVGRSMWIVEPYDFIGEQWIERK